MRTVNVSIGGENHEVSEAVARGIHALLTSAALGEATAFGVDIDGRCYYANAFNATSYAGVSHALNGIHNAQCPVPRRLPAVAVTLDERAWRDTSEFDYIKANAGVDDIPF